MATAAYNAGPSRPRNWRNGPVLEAAIWAENIPFLKRAITSKKCCPTPPTTPPSDAPAAVAQSTLGADGPRNSPGQWRSTKTCLESGKSPGFRPLGPNKASKLALDFFFDLAAVGTQQKAQLDLHVEAGALTDSSPLTPLRSKRMRSTAAPGSTAQVMPHSCSACSRQRSATKRAPSKPNVCSRSIFSSGMGFFLGLYGSARGSKFGIQRPAPNSRKTRVLGPNRSGAGWSARSHWCRSGPACATKCPGPWTTPGRARWFSLALQW
jgi:hypothetical protein